MRRQVVKLTRSTVIEGSYGGNHPECSALIDHAVAINELIDADMSLSMEDRQRVRDLADAIHDVAFGPIRRDVERQSSVVVRARTDVSVPGRYVCKNTVKAVRRCDR